MEVENTSGQGSASAVPGEIKGWNWGAFFLHWIWAIGNRVWIGLLGLVFGIVMCIILGIKGNEWAWQNRRWESVADFRRIQRKWAWWGLGVFLAQVFVIFAAIFPVVRHARAQAEIVQCVNNMQQIGTALHQFQLDEHTYPEFIAGPALAGVPLDKSNGMDATGRMVSLYPEYITSVSALHCPSSPVAGNSGLSDTVPDPMFTVLKALGATNYRSSRQFALYQYSSYDCQKPSGKSDYEAHYSKTWDKLDYSSMTDTERYRYWSDHPECERQLRWRTPPGDAVVTWCSCHRDLDRNGKPNPGSVDLVLFLDGRVERVPTAKVIEWTTAWKNARP